MIEKKSICLGSFLKASHRLRDLALVPAGYVFSKNGHFLVKQAEGAYSTVLSDACLGMKFDAILRLFVIEIRGISQLSNRQAGVRPQKFQFILSYRQSLHAHHNSAENQKPQREAFIESLTWFDQFRMPVSSIGQPSKLVSSSLDSVENASTIPRSELVFSFEEGLFERSEAKLSLTDVSMS